MWNVLRFFFIDVYRPEPLYTTYLKFARVRHFGFLGKLEPNSFQTCKFQILKTERCKQTPVYLTPDLMFCFKLLLLNYTILTNAVILGPPRLPLYGSYWFLLFANYKYTFKAIDYLARRYRTKVLGFYMGSFATVVTCDYDSIKEVLTKPEFQGRMDTFVIRDRQLGKLIGEYILINNCIILTTFSSIIVHTLEF